MGVEYCKRISINEKKNVIKVCIASSNIQPMDYITCTYCKGDNFSFEDKLIRLFYDFLTGNIHFSSVNDSTENFVYAMLKVREYLKENNIDSFEDLYRKRIKVYSNNLYKTVGVYDCNNSDEENYNKYIEWVKTQDKDYVDELEDNLYQQSIREVYNEPFKVFKKALYENVEGIYNLKYGNTPIIKIGRYNRGRYDKFYCDFWNVKKGLVFSYKKAYIVQKNFIDKDLKLVKIL